MPAPVLSGPQYLREGLKLVLSPSLRLFVLLPLVINLVLFVGLIYLASHQFSLWVDTLMPSLPDWLSFLSYILWPIFVVLVVFDGVFHLHHARQRHRCTVQRFPRRES